MRSIVLATSCKRFTAASRRSQIRWCLIKLEASGVFAHEFFLTSQVHFLGFICECLYLVAKRGRILGLVQKSLSTICRLDIRQQLSRLGLKAKEVQTNLDSKFGRCDSSGTPKLFLDLEQGDSCL
jgi:hypothetical protein